MAAGGPSLKDRLVERIGYRLAVFLQKESPGYRPVSVVSTERLKDCLLPGDILLVEGDQRISIAIKYLTQSTWSHSALYVGKVGGQDCLVEADVVKGVDTVPLSKYAGFNTRICRAVGMTPEDRRAVVDYVMRRLGMQYDVRNAIDLVRYLLPQPPVPVRWRRRMLALASGEPTRAICSTLIAAAFDSIEYPILPHSDEDTRVARELRHIRDSRLYTPRDFDISPYFEVIKPSLTSGFSYSRPGRKEAPAFRPKETIS